MITPTAMYKDLHDVFDSWLGGCEAKVTQPVKTQDNSMNITKQLKGLKVCSDGRQDGGSYDQ